MIAQEPTSTQNEVFRDPKGLQILKASIEMMAPATTQNNPNVAISGTVFAPSTPNAASGTFTAKLLGKHQLIQSAVGGHNSRSVVHGTYGKVEHDGAAKPFSPSKFANVTSGIFPSLDNWTTFDKSNVSVRILDDQTIEGTVCYQIMVGLPANYIIAGHSTYDIIIFVSKDSGILKAMDRALAETRVYSPRLRERFVYDDYKSFDGLVLPSTITRYISNTPVTILHIDTINTHQNFTEKDLDF